jgi:uncharacterized protein YqhQ
VRTPVRWSVAVRRPDGSIHTEGHPVVARAPRLAKTFLRGPIALVDAISIGMKAIRIALREASGIDATQEQFAASAIPVLFGALAVFVVAPGVLSAGWSGAVADLGEAAMRAAMLLVYLFALSRSAHAKRLFGYHGAEHMAIAAFERAGRMPTIEDAKRESPVHVRCGTDFIALLVIAAGVVFSFVPRTPLWLGGVLRLVLFPVVAVVAYEVMRAAAGRHSALAARALTWPGRALQRITTRPPADDQLEIALAALGGALEP